MISETLRDTVGILKMVVSEHGVCVLITFSSFMPLEFGASGQKLQGDTKPPFQYKLYLWIEILCCLTKFHKSKNIWMKWQSRDWQEAPNSGLVAQKQQQNLAKISKLQMPVC